MAEKENKKVLDNIKTEAKEYYSWKNMIVRYVILWFLVLLLVLQFILPHKKNEKKQAEELVQNLWEIETTETVSFNFLGENLDLSKMDSDTKIKFDKVLKKIQNDLDYKYTFTRSLRDFQ